MEQNLQKIIDRIMSVRFWKFDGLPEQITSELDDLIDQYHIGQILTAMTSLVPKFEQEEKLADACKGNSGIAGELHMAAAMKVEYLNESISYIKNKTGKIT